MHVDNSFPCQMYILLGQMKRKKESKKDRQQERTERKQERKKEDTSDRLRKGRKKKGKKTLPTNLWRTRKTTFNQLF